jgi:cytoskeletal protein CcmA (bactofilin family)
MTAANPDSTTDSNESSPATPVSKRRFLDLHAGAPTVIGAGTLFEGNVHGGGAFVVSGEVRGDGDLPGDLHLALGGKWIGNVRTQCAVIAGTILGSLEVAEKLEIGRTAVIRGRVSARTIAIAQGAIVDGQIEVTSGAPVVKFQEKRDT